MFFFWLKTGVVGFCSILFLIMGIDNLFNAYSLTHPQTFIMYFFASNLIILISLTGLLFSVFRIYDFIKKKGIKT